MRAVGEEVAGEGDGGAAQGFGKAQGVLGGDGAVGEGVPQERGREVGAHVPLQAHVVAGERGARAEDVAD